MRLDLTKMLRGRGVLRTCNTGNAGTLGWYNSTTMAAALLAIVRLAPEMTAAAMIPIMYNNSRQVGQCRATVDLYY
jgi:hypothetical protein